MIGRFRLRKILATVILTVLIWVWADMALDEELAVSNVKISVAKSAPPAMWITFSGQPSIMLDKIVLKGSARKMADVRQRINDGRFVREFYFDPEHEKMTTPGDHLLNVAQFLKGADKILQLGITVASADPNTITVGIVELQKKQAPVKCFDDNQNPLKVAGIEPAVVEAFVPADREGAALEAKVVLNKREIEQARLSAVEKTPFVELTAGQIREAASHRQDYPAQGTAAAAGISDYQRPAGIFAKRKSPGQIQGRAYQSRRGYGGRRHKGHPRSQAGIR